MYAAIEQENVRVDTLKVTIRDLLDELTSMTDILN